MSGKSNNPPWRETMWIIQDWTGKHLFPELKFKTFEDGWEFITEQFPEEGDWEELFVEPITKPRRELGGWTLARERVVHGRRHRPALRRLRRRSTREHRRAVRH